MEAFLYSAIELFNEKSVKFTLIELATRNKMSKKTIYKLYGDKEKVIELAIMAVFDSIKEEERKIFNRKDLSDMDKLKEYLCVFPSFSINYEYVDDLKHHYPSAYDIIRNRMHADWEGTRVLVEQAIEDKYLQELDFEILRLILLGIYNEIVTLDEEQQRKRLRASIDMIFKGYEIESI